MNKFAILLGVLGLSSGFLGGYVLFTEPGVQVIDEVKEKPKPLFYRNPI